MVSLTILTFCQVLGQPGRAGWRGSKVTPGAGSHQRVLATIAPPALQIGWGFCELSPKERLVSSMQSHARV